MTRGKDAETAAAQLSALLKVSLWVSLLAGVAVGLIMAATGSQAFTAVAFGVYASVYTLRAFARSRANVLGRIERAAVSDLVYSAVLIAGLLGLAAAGSFAMAPAAVMLVAAAAAALFAFGREYGGALVASLAKPAFSIYRPMWQEVARWSMLGVALTEVASNCHAYLLTFLSGPEAFGLVALGALFMRPASLVLGALPDIDQPVMTRKLAAGDIKGAFGVVNEFRTAAGAVLAATVLLAVVLVVWFPHLLLKHFAVDQVWIVLAFWSLITALRAVRTPESVFLMAAGGYSKLAWISGVSGVAALAAVFALLKLAGPVWSLGGIALGEVVMLAMLFPLNNRLEGAPCLIGLGPMWWSPFPPSAVPRLCAACWRGWPCLRRRPNWSWSSPTTIPNAMKVMISPAN